MIRIDLKQDLLPAQFNPAGFDSLVGAGLANVLLNYHASMEISDVIPRDTGILAQSIPATISISGNVGTIGTPLLYGLIMEKGRRPGKMPPVDALIPWVKRKLHPPLPPAAKARVARNDMKKQVEATLPHDARRQLKLLRKVLLTQKAEGVRKKDQKKTVRDIRKITRKISRSVRKSMRRAAKSIKKKFRIRAKEKRKATFKKLGREQSKKLRKRIASIKLRGRRKREALKREKNRAELRKDLQNQNLRSIALNIARSIARNGIAVPLKHDKRGRMFARTHEATIGRFAGWFLEPFGGRKAG